MKQVTTNQMLSLSRKLSHQIKECAPKLHQYIVDNLLDNDECAEFITGLDWYMGDRIGPEMPWFRYWKKLVSIKTWYSEGLFSMSLVIEMSDKQQYTLNIEGNNGWIGN